MGNEAIRVVAGPAPEADPTHHRAARIEADELVPVRGKRRCDATGLSDRCQAAVPRAELLRAAVRLPGRY